MICASSGDNAARSQSSVTHVQFLLLESCSDCSAAALCGFGEVCNAALERSPMFAALEKSAMELLRNL